jgi:lipid A 4'-phosphatase
VVRIKGVGNPMIKKYCAMLFFALCVIFFFFPKLDISFTEIFYHHHLDFIYRDHPLVVICFRLVPIVTMVWGGFCVIYLIYNLWRKKQVLSSPVFYLLMAVLLGPGLLINYGLKENFGRARPKHILEFGGDKAFTAPLIISDQCDKNCSFSSGHASMGYYFSALSYVVGAPYQGAVFLFGIVLGSMIGLGRVLQGGHFLSDVIFSGLFIILVNHFCFIVWRKFFVKKRVKSQTNPKKKYGQKSR